MPARRTEPSLGVYSPNFVYRPAAKTDIRKTFERVRRERKALERRVETGQRELDLDAAPATVVRMAFRKGLGKA